MSDQKRKAGRPKTAPPSTTRSIVIPDSLWEQAKEGAYMERTSVTSELVGFLTRWVAKMQQKHNGGKPFTIPQKEGR